jgi:hypothetical protein
MHAERRVLCVWIYGWFGRTGVAAFYRVCKQAARVSITGPGLLEFASKFIVRISSDELIWEFLEKQNVPRTMLG